MKKSLVVHCRRADFDVYIGRRVKDPRHPMHYGNPFSHEAGTLASVVVSTREESIKAYEDWLKGIVYTDIDPQRRLWILENLHKLKGKVLGCWCAPKACHGDVLVKLANKGENK